MIPATGAISPNNRVAHGTRRTSPASTANVSSLAVIMLGLAVHSPTSASAGPILSSEVRDSPWTRGKTIAPGRGGMPV